MKIKTQKYHKNTAKVPLKVASWKIKMYKNKNKIKANKPSPKLSQQLIDTPRTVISGQLQTGGYSLTSLYRSRIVVVNFVVRPKS